MVCCAHLFDTYIERERSCVVRAPEFLTRALDIACTQVRSAMGTEAMLPHCKPEKALTCAIDCDLLSFDRLYTCRDKS
jgi:hypothetical protein